ncbi:MAG: hypothetical protein HC923_12170, partial [Myxococcales bacterium]|nr:hypothetical protein [Myxococcales bacterium]
MTGSLVIAALLGSPWVLSDHTEDPSLAWWCLRAADRLAYHAAGLGLPVSVLETDPMPGTTSLESRCSRTGAGDTQILWTVGRGSLVISRTSKQGELERASAEIAGQLAGRQGLGLVATPADIPQEVHRLLGRARMEERNGKLLQAALLYDRAAAYGDRLWIEGVRGWARARSFGPGAERNAELAKAAAVRAGVANRTGDASAERDAWIAFLKYTPQRVPRWHLPVVVPENARIRSAARHSWIVASGFELQIPLDGGPSQATFRAPPDVLLEADERFRIRLGHELRRVDADGGERWTLGLEIPPEGHGLMGGYLGIWGQRGGRWIDPALGVEKARFRGHVVASSDQGLLLRRDDDVALVRPGQIEPSWTRPIGDVAGAWLTDERVLLRTREGLRILRLADGEAVGDAIPLGGFEPVHASRRAAILAQGSRHRVLDVMSLELGPV